MTLLLDNSSLLLTICALLIPTLLYLRPKFRRGAPLSPLISTLLVPYTLYVLYNLILARPPNLFTELHLPLNAPQSTIHAALLAAQGNTSSSIRTGAQLVLPPALEKLLARLASSEARTMLVRFGQWTVQTCSHCTAQADYALHALPSVLLSYTLAATMLGIVTLRGSAREARRSAGIMLLVFAGLGEAYWAYTVPISMPSRHKRTDIIMWHDMLWSLRHALFLVLPLTLHLLPSSHQQQHPGSSSYPPHSLPTTLSALNTRADALLARANLIRLGTASIQRVPELHARASAFWTRERCVGAAVRYDADVRAAAERVGLGFVSPGPGSTGYDYNARASSGSGGPAVGGDGGGEGALQKVARRAIKALKKAALRPPSPSPS